MRLLPRRQPLYLMANSCHACGSQALPGPCASSRTSFAPSGSQPESSCPSQGLSLRHFSNPARLHPAALLTWPRIRVWHLQPQDPPPARASLLAGPSRFGAQSQPQQPLGSQGFLPGQPHSCQGVRLCCVPALCQERTPPPPHPIWATAAPLRLAREGSCKRLLIANCVLSSEAGRKTE